LQTILLPLKFMKPTPLHTQPWYVIVQISKYGLLTLFWYRRLFIVSLCPRIASSQEFGFKKLKRKPHLTSELGVKKSKIISVITKFSITGKKVTSTKFLPVGLLSE
jgi:hypothetical protein